jgi:hypothetical protein
LRPYALKNDEAKVALSAVAERLHHCANIHHHLRRPDVNAPIDAEAYLRKLCLSISRAKLDRLKIELVLVANPLQLRAEQCWRQGMIVYELVTNAARQAVIVCGSARTSVHNQVFLRSLLATLEAAPEHIGGGRFSATPTKSLRAFARIYAGWAMSQDWYRADLHLTSTGAANLDDYLDHHWEPGFTRRKAEDLYAQAATWMASDIRRTSSIMAILFARCRRSGRACC